MREVDCRFVEERVHQFLDGELTEREADELRQHIDACAHCLDETDLIDALRKLVRRACACPPAPETLRLRVVTQIHTVRFTVVEGPGTP
ncbi:mycothiol system anti-sigma-R factor [Propioniciclava sinopodophylli]|uniref:mycothiol system anti-sigma-R factor n=1 Tax=Propioniciclava sinopodophylli TaxID=1837344 RepID=UPI002493576E|nr:mycothiol system anti-sigma-R factor [Propioniciclava sinopodophylli]